MDEDLMVTAYVVIAEVMAAAGHRSHPAAGVADAEVLTVAVVAAACFQNHQAVALAVKHKGDLSGKLSTSRFNRRLHALASWLEGLLDLLGELLATGEVFVLDSLPVLVCRRVRAALRQGPRQGVLRLLRGQAGEGRRLAAALGDDGDRRAGGVHLAAGGAA
jgi:hypothetical protein